MSRINLNIFSQILTIKYMIIFSNCCRSTDCLTLKIALIYFYFQYLNNGLLIINKYKKPEVFIKLKCQAGSIGHHKYLICYLRKTINWKHSKSVKNLKIGIQLLINCCFCLEKKGVLSNADKDTT